jgi:predicted NBD/HSP70 family sugar kinase
MYKGSVMPKITNTVQMKTANILAIYSTLRREGPQTKRDLAEKTKLSFSSVSNLTNMLAGSGLVRLGREIPSTGGRKALSVSMNPSFAYSLVIDLHNTRIAYLGLSDMMNNVVTRTSFRLEKEDTLDQLLKKIKTATAYLFRQVASPVFGVCVGVSAIQTESTIIHSNIPILEGINLKRYLSEIFPEKMIIIENDANLSVLSQMMQTEATQKNLLFIFLDEGVGLGIVIGGKLYKGTKGFAGEFGHMKVTGVTKRCKCGATGCLRLVAPLNTIAEDLVETTEYQNAESPQVYAQSLYQRYQKGDPLVVERVDLAAEKLGEACASLYDIFNPEEIIIGGNMGKLFQCISPTLRRQCMRRSHLARITDLEVQFLETPAETLVMQGAGERIFHEWEETELADVVRPYVNKEKT